MAFLPTGSSGEFHYLVEFHLDSTVLNYADEDLSIQTSNLTGTFYEGRLPVSGQISRDLGNFLEPTETVQDFNVELDNRDSKIAQHIQDLKFANRTVKVWIGQGNSKSNYSEIFTGFVAHPAGISWDQDEAHFLVVDQRIKHRRLLPKNKYTSDDYPNMEKKRQGYSIPIAYGDWRSTASGNLAVPCICIDIAASNKRFKVADHGVKQFERILRNAADVTPSVVNASLSLGEFEFVTGFDYSQTGDLISANIQGIQTANLTLIEKPQDVLRSLLTLHMGLTGDNLDVTGFKEFGVDIGSEDVRRFIDSELSTETLISELMNEAGADMRFVGGKYSPKYRSIDLVEGRDGFGAVDIVLENEQTEKAAYSVSKDPDRYYANKILANYQYDPVDGKYNDAYSPSLASAVIEASGVVERPFDFNWYYDKTVTEARVDRELVTFVTEPQRVQVQLTNRAMLKNLADQIDFSFDVFSSRVLQIRRIQTDLGTMVSTIDAFDLLLTGTGRWTSDTALGWNDPLLTQIEKDSQGFWTEDTGYVSASDTSSNGQSRWF